MGAKRVKGIYPLPYPYYMYSRNIEWGRERKKEGRTLGDLDERFWRQNCLISLDMKTCVLAYQFCRFFFSLNGKKAIYAACMRLFFEKCSVLKQSYINAVKTQA